MTAGGGPRADGPAGARVVLITVAAWLGASLLVGASGGMAGLRPPWPQVLLAAVTVLTLVLVRAVALFRAFAATVDLRALVLLHLTRFVGLYFLLLYGRGELPWTFAVPGGFGDILVAAAALLLAAFVPPAGPAARRAYLVWNVAGLLDIVAVVLTAARLAITDPPSMAALLRLPLSLLLTFVVPLIIATHLVMLSRLCARPDDAPGTRP